MAGNYTQNLDKEVMCACEALRLWFEKKNFRGNDPYQLDEAAFKHKSIPFIKQIRALVRPFHSLIPRQIFSYMPDILIPKALGLIMAGHSSLYALSSDKVYLDGCQVLLQLLKQSRNLDYKHSCWGWPFEWGSTIRYPYNTPLVCVTSPIGHALLDFYEVSGDKEALNMALDVASYLMTENGHIDFDDSICLYYSPRNQELAFNSNIMAASFLLRLYKHTEDETFSIFASKAIKFVAEGQNPDGSWFYTSEESGNKADTVIDNRHTGFVLEHLQICRDVGELINLGKVIDCGWDYYETFLIDGGVLTKWSPGQIYPIDIHDVAQVIITASAGGNFMLADGVVKWVMDKMFNGKDEFFYKFFENGRVNKAVFLRWNQAWMYRALTYWLFCHRQNSSQAKR